MRNKKRFWFHYNKPASAKQGRPLLTLHYLNKCHLVESLNIKVPTETHNRKKQPRIIVRGWANGVNISEKKADIF